MTLWNQKTGEIWSAKTEAITDPVKKEKVRVTTGELGASLTKTGAAAKVANTTGKGTKKTGAAVRGAYATYRYEMIAIVKGDPNAFSNLRRLDHWNQWFGIWLAQSSG